jgi:hypothetical protein
MLLTSHRVWSGNYKSWTDLHTLQITTAHTRSQSVMFSLMLLGYSHPEALITQPQDEQHRKQFPTAPRLLCDT